MGFFNGKDEPENGFTVEELQADAERKVALLRAMIADFVDEQHEEPLTRSEINTVSRMPLAYLEEGAALCEDSPQLGTRPRAAKILRLTHAANAIYEPVLEEADRLTRRIRQAMGRKNLEAISIARAAHRRADVLVEDGAEHRLKRHVERLKRIAGRPWRRKRQRG